jgi:hypothetical protein
VIQEMADVGSKPNIKIYHTFIKVGLECHFQIEC